MGRLIKFFRRDESGQTLIFAAVLASVLMAITGVAVEGGHMFVEFRRMQAAADMAALVGAQKLPCGLTDSTCITAAEQDACNYAQLNGYGGGWGSGGPGINACQSGTKTTGLGNATTTVTASVPPVSCSPYDFLDYGNNSSCPGRAASAINQYVFIEVQIQQPVTIPIFNVSFTLSVHAVAKQGVASPTDFAVSVLDPVASPALKMGGSGNVVVVGDTMSNGNITVVGTGGRQVSCDGSWFTAASQVVPPNSTFVSDLNGAANFANADCVGGTTLQPASFFPKSPPIPDPYGNTPPPTKSNTSSNCPQCDPTAVPDYFNIKNKTWQPVPISGLTLHASEQVELFPGYYPGGIDANASTVIYLNPGIYTFGADFKTNGLTTICIYGAPVCDRLNSIIPGTTIQCAGASFNPGDTNYVSSDTWYYYCSPFGVWDNKDHDNRLASGGPSLTPPTFWDASTNSASSQPLNGVTFYMQSGSFLMNGTASIYVAFPDGCPGTATSGYTPGGTVVPFQGNPIGEPSGYKDAYYTYDPVQSLAGQNGLANSSQVVSSGGNQTQVYPSGDLGLDGEVKCSNGLQAWQGEYPNKGKKGQHLEFLVFADNTSSSITLNGTAKQQWWGIIHTFPQNYAGYPGPPNSGPYCSGGCNVTIIGNGGAGSTGPPFVVGQTVSATANFSGNGNVEIFYRPCRALKTPCGTGPGTALVQ